MSAARYVGRVGGLAVALGIGAAFFTCQQVACAAPASSVSSAEASGPSSSSGSAANDSTKTARSASSSTATSNGGKLSTWSSATDSTGAADDTSKHRGNTATTDNGSTNSDTGTQSSPTSTDTSPPVNEGSSDASHSTTSANGGSHGADSTRGDTVTRHSEWRSKGTSSSQSLGVTSPASSTAASPHNETDPKATITDGQGVQVAAVTPRVLSGLSGVVPQSKTSVSASLSTPSVASIVTKPTATPSQTTPPPSALTTMTNVAAELVSGVLNPFAGTSPKTPTDTPASWVALAAVRREIGTASPSVGAVATGPIVYVPVAMVVTDPTNPLAGVITSSAQGTDANGLPLAYTVVAAPSAGGKVNLNPTTGTFAFLPDASVFSSPTHREFQHLGPRGDAVRFGVGATGGTAHRGNLRRPDSDGSLPNADPEYPPGAADRQRGRHADHRRRRRSQPKRQPDCLHHQGDFVRRDADQHELLPRVGLTDGSGGAHAPQRSRPGQPRQHRSHVGNRRADHDPWARPASSGRLRRGYVGPPR